LDSFLSTFESSDPPKHDEMGFVIQSVEAISILAACTLIVIDALRFSRNPQILSWTTPVATLLALPAADFVSGLVHWTADTWGSEKWPFIGRRFLRPFRVHHINPHDFLRRNFVDTNGDVAMFCLPLLLAAFSIPLTNASGRFGAVFLAAFCFWSLPTNQIHQWAHMPSPPKLVRFLQQCGVILGRQHHQVHHRSPFATNYCIINGWCNRGLAKINFFRRAECCISSLTGLTARAEEESI
jgi:hypothetical protein